MYVGRKDPKSSDDFLRPLCNEIKHLRSIDIFINIRLFCCDAPARAFISNTISHSGKHGCSKCEQTGKKPDIRTGIVFQYLVHFFIYMLYTFSLFREIHIAKDANSVKHMRSKEKDTKTTAKCATLV